MRYRPQPHRGRDELDSDDRHPGRTHDLTVYPAEAAWVPIGVLDAEGCPLRRYVGPNPIGFLWDRLRDSDNCG